MISLTPIGLFWTFRVAVKRAIRKHITLNNIYSSGLAILGPAQAHAWPGPAWAREKG